MFLVIVAVVLVVVLGAMLLMDRRRRGATVNPDQPDAARARDEGRRGHERLQGSDWNNMG